MEKALDLFKKEREETKKATQAYLNEYIESHNLKEITPEIIKMCEEYGSNDLNQRIERRNCLNEWKTIVYIKWVMLKKNYEEFLKGCESDEVVLTIIPIEMLRTLFNYLASMVALWDQTTEIMLDDNDTRRDVLKGVRLSPLLEDKFRKRTDIIQRNILYKLLRAIRNEVIHINLPDSRVCTREDMDSLIASLENGIQQIDPIDKQLNEGSKGIRLTIPLKMQRTRSVLFRKTSIKSNRLSAEKKADLEGYLSKLPESIDIQIIVMEFHEMLRSFFGWFGRFITLI